MFPIPWNKEYRKKDGTLVKIGDAMSGGGGGGSDLPPHSASDAGKVLTVDESGNLEWDTRGSGGGDTFLSLDFTKYGNRTFNGVTYNSNGASFSGSGTSTLRGSIDILPKSSNYSYTDITIYIDVKSLNLDANQHRRFIMGSNSEGFIYRDTGKWAFYSSSWIDSEITAGDFFDNCTVKIYIDSNNKWHIYKDNVLVFEPNAVLESYFIKIGSDDDKSLYTGAVFTGARVYSGNYTET